MCCERERTQTGRNKRRRYSSSLLIRHLYIYKKGYSLRRREEEEIQAAIFPVGVFIHPPCKTSTRKTQSLCVIVTLETTRVDA